MTKNVLCPKGCNTIMKMNRRMNTRECPNCHFQYFAVSIFDQYYADKNVSFDFSLLEIANLDQLKEKTRRTNTNMLQQWSLKDCPKCGNQTLEEQSHHRLFCSYTYPNQYKNTKDGSVKEIKGQPCGFACGLAFFYDDDNLDVKAEVGISIDEVPISARATELIDSGSLSMNEIDKVNEINKLEEIKRIEQDEDEWIEINAMMREVIGKSASVHRVLSSGDSYRKYKGGGLISIKAP